MLSPRPRSVAVNTAGFHPADPDSNSGVDALLAFPGQTPFQGWVAAIDPGTTHSQYLIWGDNQIISTEHVENALLLERIRNNCFGRCGHCALEMIASYGMSVGKTTFETVLWIGRFYERLYEKIPTRLVYRLDIKMHLCGSARAKDGNVAQALRDKHGEVGTKKNPGPLYGISKHGWAALAVADYLQHLLAEEQFPA